MNIDIRNKILDNIYGGNYNLINNFADYLINQKTTEEKYNLIYTDIYEHNVFSAQIFKKVLSEKNIKISMTL